MEELDPKFNRVFFNFHDEPREAHQACIALKEAISIRNKYLYSSEDQVASTDHKYEITKDKGVYKMSIESGAQLKQPPSLHDFWKDYSRVLDIINEGPIKTYSYWRLKILELKFDLHMKLNRKHEKEASRVGFKDWTTVMKVDTHVNLSTGMTPKHLLSYITTKTESSSEEIVLQHPSGDFETLSQVLKRLDISKDRMTIGSIAVEAGRRIFQRFDELSSKYSPFTFSELGNIFMKTYNHIQGRYLAELSKELFKATEEAGGLATEYRITIYGSKRNEWTSLSQWVNANNVRSTSNRWVIQIPRIFKELADRGLVKTFQETFPEEWTQAADPPYAYYIYYMYANIYALNKLRKAKGLNVFDFRPHCGETGDEDHLIAGFLLAKGINHGINLNKSTPLQYLYYLCNIGIAVSPLSNSYLVLDYKRNPFFIFFQRGLNVSLATDDPLQFHHTQTPLVEEYVVAAARCKLNECDLSEIARNSVLQSGFPHETKLQWLGENYTQHGVAGNDVRFSNVPNIRIAYRTETIEEELQMVRAGGPVLVSTGPPLLSLTRSAELTRYTYNRVVIADVASEKEPETEAAILQLREILAIRTKYKSNYIFEHNGTTPPPINFQHFSQSHQTFVAKCVDGIVNFYHKPVAETCSYDMIEPATVTCTECNSLYCTECDRVIHKHPEKKGHTRLSLSSPLFQVPSLPDFLADLRLFVQSVSSSGPLRTYCATRLDIIEHLFNFHSLLNQHLEHKARMDMALHKKGKVIQVDNHIHLTGSMTVSQLLNFVKNKLKDHPDEIVQGKETLAEMLAKIGITEKNITIDSLGVKADESIFHRFDAMKSKYMPFESSDMKNLFLRRTNELDGRYYAELVKESLAANEKLGVSTESGISLYGRKYSDWDNLGWWISHYKVESANNRWVIQIPRQYHLHKKIGDINNFQEMLCNIFAPLLDASKNPASHPFVAELLLKVTGFDIVDDEAQPERDILKSYPQTI